MILAYDSCALPAKKYVEERELKFLWTEISQLKRHMDAL